jgi:hypothetical protein
MGKSFKYSNSALRFCKNMRRWCIINDTTVEGKAQVHSGVGFDAARHDHRPRGHSPHPKDVALWLVDDGGKDFDAIGAEVRDGERAS